MRVHWPTIVFVQSWHFKLQLLFISLCLFDRLLTLARYIDSFFTDLYCHGTWICSLNVGVGEFENIHVTFLLSSKTYHGSKDRAS